jgi:hypothetical protein
MPDAPCHIINNATFDVTLSRENDAVKARAQLTDFFQQRLQPVLDQALTAYAPAGDYRIERLVIDIGSIDIFHPDSAISEKILAIISKALQRLEKPEVVSVAPELWLCRSFMGFLQTGQIPWDARIDTLSSLEKSIQRLKPEAVEPLIEAVRPLLGRTDVRQRLLAQFGIPFIQWLLEKLQPALPAAFSAVLKHQPQDLNLDEQLEIQLQVAGRLPPGSSPRAAAEAIRAQMISWRSETREQEAEEEKLEIQDIDDVAWVKDEATASETLEKAVFVSQAGVVLLHPFFTRFFEQCGLLTAEQRFFDRHCQEKAVHLLHFLAIGREHPEEPHTTVYKVLCGFDIHDPVAKNVDLTGEDRDEARRLFESVIEHWRRLKNTSPDGLRTSFLQRQGKLRHTRDGWRLTVEQQSIDILLGTLPWNLSVVRLPWLRQPVWVDWA